MNLVIFFNYNNQIPILLGLFGKENLIYDATQINNFSSSETQLYYHKKLNTNFIFYNHIDYFLNKSADDLESFDKIIIFYDDLNSNKKLESKINNIKNCKKVFMWHYGEVFSKNILEILETREYDLIYSGSNRPELNNIKNYIFDPFLSFRYFRYYIGYYWIETLIKNIEPPKYQKEKAKIFSYIRANGASSWRKEFIKNSNLLENYLEGKNSANDAYDLIYPKYKHFEAIYDYIFCNFNLIFETIDFHNNEEWFFTEKTFKGLFFGKPFLLVAPAPALKYLKENGFYILNFEFKENIETYNDVTESIKNFIFWIENSSESEIEIKYNEFLEVSKNNIKVLFNYLDDYSKIEHIFNMLFLNKKIYE